MHHWAALFSKLNVKIQLFHFTVGRELITIVSNVAQGDIKPFWAKKQHGLRKLWFLFDKSAIYLHYSAPFPHVPFTILLRVLITKAWPWPVYTAVLTLHAWSAQKIWISGHDMDIGELLDLKLAEERPFLSAWCWYFDNVFL